MTVLPVSFKPASFGSIALRFLVAMAVVLGNAESASGQSETVPIITVEPSSDSYQL